MALQNTRIEIGMLGTFLHIRSVSYSSVLAMYPIILFALSDCFIFSLAWLYFSYSFFNSSVSAVWFWFGLKNALCEPPFDGDSDCCEFCCVCFFFTRDEIWVVNDWILPRLLSFWSSGVFYSGLLLIYSDFLFLKMPPNRFWFFSAGIFYRPGELESMLQYSWLPILIIFSSFSSESDDFSLLIPACSDPEVIVFCFLNMVLLLLNFNCDFKV